MIDIRLAVPLLAVPLLVAGASDAAADAVPPEPDDCPPGSVGRTGHEGPYCSPTTCASDSSCPRMGQECREVALCVKTETVPRGGRPYDGAPETITREGDCETAMRCVDPGALEEGGDDDGGCGCAVVRPGSGLAGLAAAGVLALLVVARRRLSGR